MPNKNYVNGRAKEYRVKKQWEKAGYTVLRTAGSHGFADLIAVKDKDGLRGKEVVFIQCKPSYLPEKSVYRIKKENTWLNDDIRCRFEIL